MYHRLYGISTFGPNSLRKGGEHSSNEYGTLKFTFIYVIHLFDLIT